MTKQTRRLWAAALAVLSLVSLAGCQGNTSEDFDQFIQREFVETMESDYISAYRYMEDPASFGVDMDQVEVTLGARLDEDMDSYRKEMEDTYQRFQQFDRETLTPSQQETYDIYDYEARLTLALAEERFDYYGSPFASVSGIHYQLPTLFADWEFRQGEDVEDFITLLEDTRPYFDSALAFTREQEEQGLLMLDTQAVIDYCDGILEAGEESAVLAAIYENIHKLGLPEEEAGQYRSQVREAFVSSFLPAYQEVRDAMAQIQENGTNNEEGLAHFPDGRDYYQLLLQQNIGADLSVEEVRAMLVEKLEGHLQRLDEIIMTNTEAVLPLLMGELPGTGFASYQEILDHIQGAFAEDFPPVSDLRYNITQVNEEIASSTGVAAYFWTPALDGDQVQQLRVNPLTGDVSSIDVYSTVAHEGFPGHMYQFAYLYENLDSPYRKVLVNESAYTEGYAVYAQYQAMDYLEGIDPMLLEAYRENELATYCIILLADMGIHYDGWSQADFGTFLEEMGLAMAPEDLALQYRQLQANPCTFHSYYVGYYQFADLREKAQEALGDRFTNQGFHEAILECGTAPFFVVERHVDDYIDRQLAAESAPAAA